MSTNDELAPASLVRSRSEDELLGEERQTKRVKRDDVDAIRIDSAPEAGQPASVDETMNNDSLNEKYNLENLLPQSRSLMGLPPAPELPPDGFMHRTCEVDVGISQYIGSNLSEISGIIKQRFTDFLVYEIDLNHNVAHVKSLERPTATLEPVQPATTVIEDSGEPWPKSFDEALSKCVAQKTVEEIKALFLAGPKLPSPEPEVLPIKEEPSQPDSASEALPTAFTDGRDTKKARGKGHERKPKPKKVEDTRRVVSDPIPREARSIFHQLVRDLFKSKLETFTDESKNTTEGAPVVIKWSGTGGKGSRRSATDRDHQPYIHFTLQKTNRDTSDALTHLSRLLKTDNKNLTVAGTKDKRGVTCQRVCLKRGRMSVEEVWDKLNSVGRKSLEEILTTRGERGVRVSDIAYRKGHLQLGMLKGNEFLITLRNVKSSSLEAIDQSMEVLKSKGFINYYGMQRFGTASIPTHAIGLALLRSDWPKAVDLILRRRPGESPDIDEARRIWAEEKDFDKALSFMPRRVVAERCLLESFSKMRDTRNMMGAISTIPRNLRMMYVHAYQSYVWNAIVSERIKRFGHELPVAGDVVYAEPNEEEDQDEPPTQGRGQQKSQRFAPKKVKVLKEEDLSKYTIYDVLMPLPGTDVAYPGGELGELYQEFLRIDGLDPSNFNRKQREYSLAGSYRKILHLPKEVSWKTMRYTDPDISLAQTDEDRILGMDPPQNDDGGLFLALQIRLQLGTASYATMALREVTKVDTSSHIQTSMTTASEDQLYKGVGREDAVLEDVDVDTNVEMVATETGMIE